MKKIIVTFLSVVTFLIFTGHANAATLDAATPGDTPSSTISVTDADGNQLAKTDVVSSISGPVHGYTNSKIFLTDKINNPTNSPLVITQFRIKQDILFTNTGDVLQIVNDDGQNVSALVGNPTISYLDLYGATISADKAVRITTSKMTLPPHTAVYLKTSRTAESNAVDAVGFLFSLVGTGLPNNSVFWRPRADMAKNITDVVPVALYNGTQKVGDSLIKLSGTLLPSTAQTIDVGSDLVNGVKVEKFSFEGVYKLDISSLKQDNALPGKFKIKGDLPSDLYVYVRQTDGGAGQTSYGIVVDTPPLKQENLLQSSKVTDAKLFQNETNTDGDVVTVQNGTMPLFEYGFNADDYDADTATALKGASGGQATYAPLQIQVEEAVTGHFVYIDADTGQQVGTQYFGNKNDGDIVDNKILTPPDKFILTDKKTSHVYKNGNVPVEVTRVTDVGYQNLNADGTGKTAQEVTKANKGMMAQGITLISVPSFAGTGATGAPIVTLAPDGPVRYQNMFSSSFKLVMAASKMTALKTRVTELPIQSITTDNSLGATVDVFANQDGNGDGLTADYGQVIAHGSGKTGQIALGNLTVNLFSNGDATTYTGTITYSAVQDDLIDSVN